MGWLADRNSRKEIDALSEKRDAQGLVAYGEQEWGAANPKIARLAFERAVMLSEARAITFLAWMDLEEGEKGLAFARFEQAYRAGDYEGIRAVSIRLEEASTRAFNEEARTRSRVDWLPLQVGLESVPMRAAAAAGSGDALVELYEMYHAEAKRYHDSYGGRTRMVDLAADYLDRAIATDDVEVIKRVAGCLGFSSLRDTNRERWRTMLRTCCEAGAGRACRILAREIEDNHPKEARELDARADKLKKKQQRKSEK